MNRKARLQKGKRWAKAYTGNRSKIISAYAGKFKVSKLCAINDLTSFGIQLNQEEIDRIRLEYHYNHVQHLPKKKLLEIQNGLNNYRNEIDL